LFDADDDAIERFVYANNNFHKNSITNRLVLYFKQKIKEAKEKGRVHNFFHLRVDAVKDMNTFEPNWPEKTTAQYWRNKYEDMPYRSFMREYMNTHIAEGKIFKATWIQYKKMLAYSKYDAIVAYGDLSWKDEACHKSIVMLGKVGREFHILHIFFRQTSRADVAVWLYDLFEDRKLNGEAINYMFEGLFAMSEFSNDFDEEGDNRGYYIPIVASMHAKGNKEERIESMSGYFQRMQVFWNIAEKDNADSALAVETYLAFEKGAKIPLDFLDAFQGAVTEVNQLAFIERFDILTTPRSTFHKNRY